MSTVVVNIDASGIARIEAALKAAAARAPDAIGRALNWTGERVETRAARALAEQTGLTKRTAKKALHRDVNRASAGNLAYRMHVKGGDVSLKYFGPRETRSGVSAAPWNNRRVFAGTFMKGGLFPNRKDVPRFHGQVFQRAGKSKFPIVKARSGLFIPVEATRGKTAQVFNETVAALLPARVEHEVGAILSGVVR